MRAVHRPKSACCTLILCVLSACGATDRYPVEADPLPSWSHGVARDAIVTFVATVTDPAGPTFVAPADRVAVFDNDGTLIVERPTIVQFAFIYDRVQALAKERPEWATTQPFKAVIEDDLETLRAMGFAKRRALVAAAQADITQDEFNIAASDFLSRGRHPRFQERYVDVVYQPMLELMKFLQSNDFKVFIVSGGGIEFIRRFSEPVYGVPKENVIGSSWKIDLREQDDRLVIYRKSGLDTVNAGRFKPINIQLHTGRRPILAVGNSDGDLEMLRFTGDSAKSSLALLVHHDDPDREYAYSDDSARVRQAAADRGWQAISMRDDFKRIFPDTTASP